MNTEKQTKKFSFGKILARACCIFTPVVILLYTVGALVSNSEKSFIPTLSTVYLIMVISVAVAFSSLLYKSTKMSFAAAHFINFILFAVFYYFVVVVMRNNASNGGYTLVAMVLYVLIYAIVTLCLLGTKAHKTKKINDIRTYDSKFD